MNAGRAAALLVATGTPGACRLVGEVRLPAAGDLPLQGKTVVVTGTLLRYGREEIEDVIRKAGVKTQ